MPAINPDTKITLMLPKTANISSVHPAPSAREELKAGGRNKIEPAANEANKVTMPGQKPPARARQTTPTEYVVNGAVVDNAGWSASLTTVPARTTPSAEP